MTANQEMIVQMTWMDTEWRKKVFLETKAFDKDRIPADRKLRPYGAVKSMSGKEHHGRVSTHHHEVTWLSESLSEGFILSNR